MPTTNIPKRLLIIIGIMALAGFVVAAFSMSRPASPEVLTPTAETKTERSFAYDIRICNGTPTEHRYSCYLAAISGRFGEQPEEFLAWMKTEAASVISFAASRDNNNDVTYAIFGTNCHTFYHSAGDFVAQNFDGDLATLIGYGPATCTNAYTMGLYKRLALEGHFSTDLLMEFWNKCKEGAQNQCAHEIGHILHDKYSYSILKTLDGITEKEYGLTLPAEYAYVTFPRAEPDLDAPFAECREILPEEKWETQCFTGIGHNLFLFSEFSPDGHKAEFEECDKTDLANRENCYAFFIYRIGINDAATRFLSNDFEEGNRICTEAVALSANPDFMRHCYIGVGGGIGLFLDSEYSGGPVSDENLVAAKKEILDGIRLCEASPAEFIDHCFRGIFGTRIAILYKQFGIYHERVEQLLPTLTDFEIVG